jgi:hypothetical protein
VQWLRSQTPPCPFDDKVFKEALLTKNVEVLQFLVADGAPCDWKLTGDCESAIMSYDVNVLKWLCSLTTQCPWERDKICELAIKYGKLDMLQWLVAQDYPLKADSYYLAAAYDRLDILGWLYKQNQVLFNQKKYSLMKSAARYGHIRIMNWIHSSDPSCKWDNGITSTAAQCRKFNALVWLRSQNPPCPWDERKLYDMASSRGDVMLMKCLRHLNSSYPWHDSFCTNAAKNGHLKMLRWLRCQEPPCPIKLNVCIELAAKKRLIIEVVDWLRVQSGCANCSRENCRCKNREIKVPVNYDLDRNKILYNRTMYDDSLYTTKRYESSYFGDYYL